MKIEINNLTALIQGIDLSLYQRSLAVDEWYKLLSHVKEMEQALSLGAVLEQSELFYCADWNRCGTLCEEQCNACNKAENMPEVEQ